ncbi:MAG TPA: hypothetical protein VMV27_02475 [Candidatus Binataceae bacterium]|nr:hypothetical protein [Candidatus Binataceae bacterium]
MKRIIVGIVAGTMFVIWSTAGLAQQSDSKIKKPSLKEQVATLTAEVATLTATVAALQKTISSAGAQNAIALGQYVTVDPGAENGLKGPHVIIKGANVHIESGSGATVDTSGLGNLVIGYDEDSVDATVIDGNRSGSHNLVIGPQHEFTASGGLLAGYDNFVSANYASADGGECNSAGANMLPFACSGAGGVSDGASVSGGYQNVAIGNAASVAGGQKNTASGGASSVSGGYSNSASNTASSVSGGESNTASGIGSSVNGGFSNTASGSGSSVGGGASQTASGTNQDIN